MKKAACFLDHFPTKTRRDTESWPVKNAQFVIFCYADYYSTGNYIWISCAYLELMISSDLQNRLKFGEKKWRHFFNEGKAKRRHILKYQISLFT